MSITFVQNIYAAFGRGDLDALMAACQPDVAWCDFGRPADSPTFGARHGVDDVRDFFGLLAAEMEFESFAPREFHHTGNRVFVLGHSRLRARRTGVVIDTDWVHLFVLKDGKLAAFTEYADTAQFADAYRPVRADRATVEQRVLN